MPISRAANKTCLAKNSATENGIYINIVVIFTQMLSGLKSLLDKWPCLELREAAAQFLGKCGSIEIPEHLEVRERVFLHSYSSSGEKSVAVCKLS